MDEPTPEPEPVDTITTPAVGSVYYLALGDSYTIGQSVAEQERFPVQLANRLKADSFDIAEVKIVARTGWTTDELQFGIATADLPHAPYDVISLLIGVNNQYRGRSLENYQEEFAELLQKAVQLTGGRADKVIVLSIPDYGVTPFVSSDEDAARIAREIDEFNIAAANICTQQHVFFLNITQISRQAENDASLIASDGLHPSGKMYAKWVDVMLPHVKRMLE